jgi:hypothetical protein
MEHGLGAKSEQRILASRIIARSRSTFSWSIVVVQTATHPTSIAYSPTA